MLINWWHFHINSQHHFHVRPQRVMMMMMMKPTLPFSALLPSSTATTTPPGLAPLSSPPSFGDAGAHQYLWTRPRIAQTHTHTAASHYIKAWNCFQLPASKNLVRADPGEDKLRGNKALCLHSYLSSVAQCCTAAHIGPCSPALTL